MTSRRYALRVQPKSLSRTPVTPAISQFAILDGRTRLASSRRSRRHPLTTSYPSSIFSRRCGMSCGSFCRSPSRKTSTSPRLKSIPACTAAVGDVQDLKGGAERFQHADQLAVQRLDAVDLVIDEHDHGYVRRIGRSLARH